MITTVQGLKRHIVFFFANGYICGLRSREVVFIDACSLVNRSRQNFFMAETPEKAYGSWLRTPIKLRVYDGY